VLPGVPWSYGIKLFAGQCWSIYGGQCSSFLVNLCWSMLVILGQFLLVSAGAGQCWSIFAGQCWSFWVNICWSMLVILGQIMVVNARHFWSIFAGQCWSIFAGHFGSIFAGQCWSCGSKFLCGVAIWLVTRRPGFESQQALCPFAITPSISHFRTCVLGAKPKSSLCRALFHLYGVTWIYVSHEAQKWHLSDYPFSTFHMGSFCTTAYFWGRLRYTTFQFEHFA